MKHRVQKSTGVPVGQHKTITVGPLWVGGRKSHDFVKQSMSHGGAPHWSTGVSTVCFLYDVGTQATNGIDAGGIDGRRHFLFFLADSAVDILCSMGSVCGSPFFVFQVVCVCVCVAPENHKFFLDYCGEIQVWRVQEYTE